jgi:hypothetical protein
VVEKVCNLFIGTDWKAIVIAHNHQLYPNILENAQGIMFLGTPHRGADLAGLLSNLLTATFSRRIFTSQLRAHNETLEDLHQQFLGRTKSLHLISYYESEAMRGGQVHPFISTRSNVQVIVPRYSATLELPGEKTSALNGNHLEIAKFMSENDNNYVRVAANISRLVERLSLVETEPNVEVM